MTLPLMMDATRRKPELRVAPLARDTLHERAYRRICDLILDGEIAPGQVVTIQNLAEAFGVSTMPVREALKRLTAAGALSLVTGRSMGIPRLSLERLADLRRVRLSVEGIGTEWAAELMEPSELARLRRQCALLSRAAEEENVKDYSARQSRLSFYHLQRGAIAGPCRPDRNAVAADRAVSESSARIGKLRRIKCRRIAQSSKHWLRTTESRLQRLCAPISTTLTRSSPKCWLEPASLHVQMTQDPIARNR